MDEPRPAPGDRAVTITAADVARAAGGRLVNGDPGAAIDGVSIDTRTLKPGDLYFAIQGERLDGHAFVRTALEGGAGGVVVSETTGLSVEMLAGRPLVAVGDTTTALQRLARWVRRHSRARVVAITGSAGKTTTKEMAASFLALRHDVMRSSGNLNNHIGLPLSLLELRRGAEVAVVELGMNHAGEISRLVSIAEPDVRVWTNVAEVHTAFFDSIEAIADAKAEVLEGASAATVLVANADDPRVMARVARFPGKILTFSGGGDPAATVVATDVAELGLQGTRATVRTPAGTFAWRLPLLGRANLVNSLAALAVGIEFGVAPAEMAACAAAIRPAAHRGEVVRLAGRATVVDDSYNSNPRALQAALGVLAADGSGARRLAVLGEMLELGERSLELHEECGRSASAAGLAVLVTVGGEPAAALAAAAVQAGMDAAAVRHCADSDEAAAVAAGLVRPGDVVLVKGSRGIRTERVVERLKREFGEQG